MEKDIEEYLKDRVIITLNNVQSVNFLLPAQNFNLF